MDKWSPHTGVKGNNMTENTGVENSDVAESQQSVINQEIATPDVSDNKEVHESDQDKNWKAVRGELSHIRNERDQLKNQIQELSKSIISKKEADEEIKYNDDDLVEYGSVKKLVSREMAQIKSQLANYNQKMTNYEQQLQYPDFETVVTQDVLDEISKDPAFERAILDSKDPRTIAYKFAKSGYKDIVKKNDNLSRMKQNVSNPSSVNNAKSGSASLGGVDYINSLSDKDFQSHVAKIKMRTS